MRKTDIVGLKSMLSSAFAKAAEAKGKPPRHATIEQDVRRSPTPAVLLDGGLAGGTAEQPPAPEGAEALERAFNVRG